MKKFVLAIILSILITGCQPGQALGLELTATSTITLTPTTTATPTLTATPTITLTPTITPTPTATKVGGGSGLIIGNCSSIGEQIYLLDLAKNEFKTARELTKTTELWEADYVMSMSPTRDRIIWKLIEYREIVTGWNNGVEYLKNYSSHEHQDFISNGNFSDNAIPYKGEIPDLWLPGDVGLFIEEDLSEEFISNTGLKSHPDLVYIGDFDGKNKKLLGKYLYARWETGELSPDNKYYVFPSIDHNEYYGPGSIIIVDLQTRTLEDYPYYMYGSISWAPDSSRFIYHGTVPDGDKQKSGLFLFDMNNRQVQFYKEDANVVWSPDGEWLAGYDYGGEKDFAFIMRPDGTDFTTINLPAASIRGGFKEFYWLRDNSGLFIITHAYRTESTQFNHLFFYNLANEHATFIHEFSDYSFFSGRNIYPSPDEKWIILKTFGRDESMMSLMVVLTYWDVCNIEGCVPFSPPGTSECRFVEWAGPYPPNYVGALFGTR